MKVKLLVVERNVGGIEYLADIEVDGSSMGYVKKAKGEIDYVAYIDGKEVGWGRTVADVRRSLTVYLKSIILL